ncbi:hypothetical protein Pint_15636 [Pistacia integerrima]|uniref:Uncharacterized protein n=1 Tax=Pistacia integerrima TaxID=434235 RepID=A0ACC0ZD98_9ROSI|nr:hypothetical protein Pint_15636 [Pistacia integerrima]
MMEGVGVLGVSSSASIVCKRSCSLSYASNKLIQRSKTQLAAFLLALPSFPKISNMSSSIQNHCSQLHQTWHLPSPLGRFPAYFSIFIFGEQVEETYIMVKPDGVQRGLVGEIISRFERKGFKLTGLKLFQCPQELAEEHYKDLKSKPFFPKLIEYITSGPVICMAWEGVGVVASARKLIGSTNPLQAEPGTIRGDLAVQTGRNVVHGSDSPENGKREIALWFKEGELCQWIPAQAPWLTE